MNLLKKYLEKMKKTGFGHVFFSGFANKIITFLSSYILIRILSKADYGVYSYGQYILNLFMIVSGMGIVSGLIQIFCENPDNNDLVHSYLRKGSYFALVFNSILTVGIFVYAVIFGDKFDGLRNILFVMMFIPIFDVQYELILIYYRGTIDNKKYSYLSIINSILVLALSNIGALLFGALGLVVFRVLSTFLTIVIAIVFFKFPVRDVFKKNDIELKEWKLVLKLSFIAMLNNSATIIMQNIDGLLLGQFLNDSELVASYKVATYIPTGLAFLPQALVIYIYPFFVSHRGDKKWVRNSFLKIVSIFGLVNLVITILVWVLAPYFVPIIFGEVYENAVDPLRILIVTYFFNATFRNTAGNILASQRKLNVNFWLGLIGVVINIVGDILLIPRYGMNGAAFATALVVIFVALTSSIYLLFFLKPIEETPN